MRHSPRESRGHCASENIGAAYGGILGLRLEFEPVCINYVGRRGGGGLAKCLYYDISLCSKHAFGGGGGSNIGKILPTLFMDGPINQQIAGCKWFVTEGNKTYLL